MRRAVLIGDSQAVGLAQGLEQALPAQGYTLEGLSAEEGWTTARMVEAGRVRELVQRVRPALAIVVLGGNDTAGPALVDRLVELRLQLANAGRVLWIGPAHATRADVARRHAQVAMVQSQYAAALGYVWLDGASMTRGLEHAPDGVHFTRSARERWASTVAHAVRRTEPHSALRAVLAGVAGLGVVFALARFA